MAYQNERDAHLDSDLSDIDARVRSILLPLAILVLLFLGASIW